MIQSPYRFVPLMVPRPSATVFYRSWGIMRDKTLFIRLPPYKPYTKGNLSRVDGLPYDTHGRIKD
jgi:hypothetical protein